MGLGLTSKALLNIITNSPPISMEGHWVSDRHSYARTYG
jgi:hypothetical protein